MSSSVRAGADPTQSAIFAMSGTLRRGSPPPSGIEREVDRPVDAERLHHALGKLEHADLVL